MLENRAAYSEGVFYYNLGTLQIKKGEVGVARYNLEKALVHGFQSSQVTHNLDLVKEKKFRFKIFLTQVFLIMEGLKDLKCFLLKTT